MENTITATTTVNAPIEKVWKLWISPEDIKLWNNISDDWYNLKVENDARTGGKFLFVMGPKDGRFTFEHTGVYDEVIPHQLIRYTLNDGRRSTIVFESEGPVHISETFEPTTTDPIDMQRGFCQAVLDAFKKYAEGQ